MAEFPQGRIIEIYSLNLQASTTLTPHLAAECQKEGGTVALIDAEHALDTVYAAKLGVDIPNTLISQPDNGEQALEIADMLVRSGSEPINCRQCRSFNFKAEIDYDMGDSHMGLQARLMSQALRKLIQGLYRALTVQ